MVDVVKKQEQIWGSQKLYLTGRAEGSFRIEGTLTTIITRRYYWTRGMNESLCWCYIGVEYMVYLTHDTRHLTLDI